MAELLPLSVAPQVSLSRDRYAEIFGPAGPPTLDVLSGGGCHAIGVGVVDPEKVGPGRALLLYIDTGGSALGPGSKGKVAIRPTANTRPYFIQVMPPLSEQTYGQA